MLFTRWRMVICAMITSFAGALLPAGETDPSSDAKSARPEPQGELVVVEDVVARLGSSEFSVRQKATEQLVQFGAAAVAPVLDAMKVGGLEIKSRGLLILQAGFTTDDSEQVFVAGEAIELLAERSDPIGQRALRILHQHADIREQMALRRLSEAGGIVGRLPSRGTRAGAPDPEAPNRGRTRETPYLTLNRQWKGGIAGIRLIKRITNKNFSVYIIKGTPLSDEELAELKRLLPVRRIQERGEAHLGVVKEGTADGICRIGRVAPNSAADKGGLQAADIIVEFAGKPVESFQTLVELISECSAGQSVKVRILRENETRTLDVELGTWSAG